MAPSQPWAAVAGVQLLLRQHWPTLFFQTSPEELRQLSTVCAPAAVAMATVATSIATLVNFIMVFLIKDKAAAWRQKNPGWTRNVQHHCATVNAT
jgi:hypothetical protein